MLVSSNDTLANTCHIAKRSQGLNGCGERCLCFLRIALVFFTKKRLEQSKGFDLAFEVVFMLLRDPVYPLSVVDYSAILGSLNDNVRNSTRL